MKQAAYALFAVLVMLGSTAGSGAPGGAAGPGEIAYVADLTGVVRTLSAARETLAETTVPAQRIEPGTLLVHRHRKPHKDKVSRDDQEFFAISRTGSNDVPEAALRAYHHAADVLAATDPSCGIPWTLLAAVGRVESDHGRYGGAVLSTDGVSRPEIRGPQLDGSGPFAAIPDSDGGALDGDPVWDRAVGPMQFLPSTWRAVGQDGDGNGTRDPGDLDDAALGAGVYLCSGGGNLADLAGMAQAVYRYNASDYYVSLVLSYQQGYATGVFAVPSPPPPADPIAKPRPHAPRPGHGSAGPDQPGGQHPSTSTSSPASSPAPSPAPSPASSTPSPTASPSPSPSPTGPALTALSGVWQACGTGYCVGTTALDLGGADVAAAPAAADFDGDDVAETAAEEFEGLVGQPVDLKVAAGSPALVYVINGLDFRNADGSFS